MGGGDKSGGGAPKSLSATSGLGDVTSNLNLDLTSNNAFSVGGSGSSSQAASADKSSGLNTPAQVNNTILYVGLGILGVAVLGLTIWSATRK